MSAPGALYARALVELTALIRAGERLSAVWDALPADLQDALHEQLRLVRRERNAAAPGTIYAPEAALPVAQT